MKNWKVWVVVFLINISLSYAYLSITLLQDRCWERENEQQTGYPDNTNLCENPGDVNNNDGSYEEVADGNRNRYESIRTAHNFNFPNYCFLMSVDVCTDFYMTSQKSCTGTQVSRDGGTGWSTSFGICPTSDIGTTCYDVTSQLAWALDCSDFQNNQSEVYIEAQDDLQNSLFVDYIIFQLNYTTPPNITNPDIYPLAPTTLLDLNCSVNVTDNEETPLTVNFTWYKNAVQDNTYNNQVVCQNNTVCFTSILVPSSATQKYDNWTCAAFASDGYTNSSWYNTTVQIQNSQPVINNISINNNNSIDMLAAQNKTIFCNGSVTEPDGFSDILSINATFFSNTFALSTDLDNRSTHYTNSSCSFTNNPGSEQSYYCSFSLDYYASNGTWICNVTITDGNQDTDSINGNIDINPLAALGFTPTVLDFGELQVNQLSAEQTLNIINYGNLRLDLEVFGYASADDDNLSMICERGVIPLSYQRFNFSSGLTFNAMSALSGKSAPISLNTDLNQRVWDGPESISSTYWRLLIPTSRKGICNGKVVFTGFPG